MAFCNRSKFTCVNIGPCFKLIASLAATAFTNTAARSLTCEGNIPLPTCVSSQGTVHVLSQGFVLPMPGSRP